MGVEAYVASQPDLDLGSSLVLIAPYDAPVRYALTASSFPSIQDSVRFQRLAVQPRFLDQLLGALAAGLGNTGSKGSHLDIVAPRNPPDALPLVARYILGRNRSTLRWVVIDEGIGSYNYQAFPQRKEQTPQQSGWRQRLLAYLRQRSEPWVRSHPWETRYVFRVEASGRLVPNPSLASVYLEQLRARPCIRVDRHAGPIALFVTDPGSAAGYYDVEDERRVMTEIVRRLKDRGYRLIIKAHPSEPVGLYAYLRDDHVDFADGSMAAEALAAHLLPGDIVVGISSSALYAIQLLTGIPTYSAAEFTRQQVTPSPGSLYPQWMDEFCSLVAPSLSGTVDDVPRCSDVNPHKV